MLTLTLDSSVLINSSKKELSEIPRNKVKEQSARILIKAHQDGLIEANFNFGEPPKSDVELEVILNRGPWILGVPGFSEIGVSTYLGCGSIKGFVEEVWEIIVEGRNVTSQRRKTHLQRDYALLVDHIDKVRDIFVTEDMDYLKETRLTRLNDLGLTILTAFQTNIKLLSEGVLSLDYLQYLVSKKVIQDEFLELLQKTLS